jgi:hypothetical protein
MVEKATRAAAQVPLRVKTLLQQALLLGTGTSARK